MIYKSPQLLAVCIANCFVPALFRTKRNEMQLLICSNIWLYHKAITLYLTHLLVSYQNKIDCIKRVFISRAMDSKCDGFFFTGHGIDSKYNGSISKCNGIFFTGHGIDSRYNRNISRCDGINLKHRENILRCDKNIRKCRRNKISRIRNRIASCRNIIYWLSFIISNFNNCLRVHSNKLFLFDFKKEKNGDRITDWYLEKHSIIIINHKAWLNFRDRSPPIDDMQK